MYAQFFGNYLLSHGITKEQLMHAMQEAMDEVQMVVEGVYSAKAAVKLGEKYGVSLPIINKVSEVLFDGKDPKEAVNELMLRDNKAEHTALPWEG